jgi:hypothetical protein
MMNRLEVDGLLRELYTACMRGDPSVAFLPMTPNCRSLTQAVPLGSPSPLWASDNSVHCFPYN